MWMIWSLGDLDLRWPGQPTGVYLVDESSGDPVPTVVDEHVPNSGSDGARLAYSREAETQLQLNIMCWGDDLGQAKANRTAIRATLAEARSNRDNPTVVYEFQEDSSEGEPESWFCIGGRVRDVRTFSGTSRPFGFNGRRVVLAAVTLYLTKS